MDKHLVAFIDLLGFRSIITKKGDLRQEQILLLLTTLHESRGDAELTTKPIDQRTIEIVIRPAISAFSDNIIFSFTEAGLMHVGSGPAVSYLADQAASIFTEAMQLGCLIRGGVSFGPLHHAGGVVFGPALVEAYELESRFAQRPRIVISQTATARIKEHPYLHIDDDGFTCLDYMHARFDQIGREEGIPGRRKWISETRKDYKEHIAELEQSENLAGLQNWRWSQARFESFIKSRHPTITGDPQST